MSDQIKHEIQTLLKITRITAFEDRADVLREGVLELPEGSSVVVVGELPAVLSDEHVVARLEPLDQASGDRRAHVNDVRVDRRIVGGEDILAARKDEIQKELEAIDDEMSRADESFKRATVERAQAEVALRRFGEALTRAVGRNDGSAAQWKQSIGAFEEKLAAIDAKRATRRAALDALKRKRTIVAQGMLERRPGATGQRTIAELRLRISGAAGRYKLIVSTLLPCAAWRPTHEAHLVDGDANKKSVRFVTYAAVWNRTGEAWNDVELILSTARPSAGAELPPVRADRLTLRTKTAEERKTIVVEHREESVPKSATQGTAPGVDDGGEARTFRASKATVPDDGRPHRVEVATFTAPCTVERVAFPELVSQVFLRASLKNAGAAPILAGPVTLLMLGTYVGTGDVAFVGAGEAFDLSFGSDDRFTVRTKKRRVDDKKIVGKDIVHFVREATLIQTGTTPERVVVHLRLPVSELKQLKVLPSPQHSTVDLNAEAKPDEHGVVRVPVELQPNVEKKVAIAFSFDTSGDVRIPDPW